MRNSVRYQLLAAVCMAPLSISAHAQERDPDRAEAQVPEVGEIVVTANRRSEKLQDVPLSIQALGGEELKKMQAVNFADYARAVAGVQFQDDGPGRSQIFIRGVSSGADIDTGKESTVGVYFDETPVSEGSSQPDLKLFDISRIEVLRGPQGTLYGSGSLGGTVRIITNQPEFDLVSGYGEVTGSVTKSGTANGAVNAWVNLPLGTGTALRVVGYGLHNAGFLDNGLTGEKNINDESTYGGRAAFRHKASDSVDITLTGMYQRSKNGSYTRVTDHYSDLVKDESEPEPFTDRFGTINLKIDADLGFAALTSSSSYFDRKRQFDNDIDYFLEAVASIPSSRSLLRYKAKSLTQEVRLTSKGNGGLQWLVGGFFVDRDEAYFQAITINGLPAPTTPEENLFYGTTDSSVRQIAGFGELSYEPADGLKLTGGLRVADIVRKADAVKGGGFFGGILDRQTGRYSGTATTPKFNISYKIDPTTLVYAQASKGFRIGGTNPGLPPCADCLVDVQSEFKPDNLWNYEVGLKSQPLGDALTLNASLFWIDWKNIQLSVSREDGFAGFANAGRARSRGFELEMNSRLSRNVSMGGQVTYTDAKLRSLDPGVEDFATTGVQLPQVPRWSASGFGEWGADVGSDGWLSVRGDIQYQGKRQSMLGPTATVLDDYAIANVRISYARPDWTVSAFVTNLADARAQLARDILFGVRDGVDITLDRYTINTPRTFGLSFSYNF